MAKKHLAIFTPPFIDLILKGAKTIESRFSKVRGLPYGRVAEGDIVLMKESGGLVQGEFTVAQVKTFNDLTPAALKEIARRYSKELRADADPAFWKKRKNARYATFMYVSKQKRYIAPYPYPKRDRRSWVILEDEPGNQGVNHK